MITGRVRILVLPGGHLLLLRTQVGIGQTNLPPHAGGKSKPFPLQLGPGIAIAKMTVLSAGGLRQKSDSLASVKL